MVAQERPLLILDLDETLIRASTEEPSHTTHFSIAGYFVACRPNLARFITETAKHFDIGVWSSGTEAYVSEIVRQIFPDNLKPVFVWSRERCTQRREPDTDETYWVKDLKKATKLGYPISRILILEDNKLNVQKHYGNAIYISTFCGDETDSELEILGAFIYHIRQAPDFRTVEKRNWRSFLDGKRSED